MDAVIAGTSTTLTQAEPLTVDDDKIDLIMQPAGFRILVEILSPADSLKRWQDSKLQMPDEVRDREWAAQVWARVMRLGPLAFRDRKRFGFWRRPWCKPGNYIIMRPYSGTRFMVRGRLYALINDDTVQAVAGDVSEIERA